MNILPIDNPYLPANHQDIDMIVTDEVDLPCPECGGNVHATKYELEFNSCEIEYQCDDCNLKGIYETK